MRRRVFRFFMKETIGMSYWMDELKRTLTTVRIDTGSGLLLQPDCGASDAYIRRVRVWNFIEPYLVFGLMMAAVWISGMDKHVWWFLPSAVVLCAWALILSPIVHYPFEKRLFLTLEQQRWGFAFYFFECRGLGNPIRYYFPMYGEPAYIIKYWKTVLGVLIFINLLFASALITFNKEIGERYAAQMATPGQAIFFRFWLVARIDLALVFVAFPFILRLDNFTTSLKYMSIVLVWVVLIAVIGNLLFSIDEPTLREWMKDSPAMSLRGPTAIERLHSLDVFAVGGQWAGYWFWGFLQQLLFMGIFSTQLCRAFDIGRSRLHLFLACLFSAALFGLVHVPNFWLSVVTWIGGFLGSVYALQCRNLLALGIVHGLGGTMINKLLPISLTVGPPH